VRTDGERGQKPTRPDEDDEDNDDEGEDDDEDEARRFGCGQRPRNDQGPLPIIRTR